MRLITTFTQLAVLGLRQFFEGQGSPCAHLALFVGHRLFSRGRRSLQTRRKFNRGQDVDNTPGGVPEITTDFHRLPAAAPRVRHLRLGGSEDPSIRGTSTARSASRVRHTDPTRGKSSNLKHFLHGRQASNQFDSLRLSLQRGPKTTVPLVSSWLSNRAAGPEDPSIRGTSTARAQAVSPRTASARLQSAAMQVPDKFPRLANWHAEILCQLLGKKVRFALTLPSHLNNP